MMFDRSTEYAHRDLVDNFTPGILYNYIAHSFLDGYINFVEPVKAYLLERYITQGPKYGEQVWKPFIERTPCHTRFSELKDDVLILAKSDKYW